ncbi:hypothetical protein E2562_031845 [Oryza meyeriana var. granulata]|uniref:Reverse transcriptase/retrotransposon-derived protein RNase H-like domain-containing protein n=1 Tax=Oryza meyeriana var. granulata TaxID=110450 RepID=A0A6G1C2Y9_9ORYZ|nr:hypothetical protein E2562_031845 [Oryza meyeriana var. granulata]
MTTRCGLLWSGRSHAPLSTVSAFLRLVGYYRKFICRFREIAAPLTKLLKKEAFAWTADASAAFDCLKDALTTAHDC